LDRAIELSLLGATLALDYAMVGPFMVSQPLVLGGLFGWVLGDVTHGLLVGALIQLIWISVLPVGAYVPSDYTVTAGVSVALTEMLVRQGHDFEPSMGCARGVAIPAGMISGKLDIGVRHLNSRLAQYSELVADRFGSAGIAGLNLAGLVPAFLRNLLLYLVWLIPGSLLAAKIFKSLPPQAVKGLGLTFWLLPAISFAVVLEIIAKEEMRGWIAGAFCATLVTALIWPAHGLWIFSAGALVGAVVAWRRRGW